MTTRPSNTQIKHGDPTCADYGCKREECLQARRDKKKRNRFLRQTGRPGFVPADRAIAHIRKFRLAGLQDKEIMPLVGVGRTTYYRCLRNEPITRDSEGRILSAAAPAVKRPITTTSRVSSVGSHRRLQALMWLGWPHEVLEERLEVFPYWIGRTFRGSGVRLSLADRVSRLYDELWSVRPESQGVEPDRAEQVREHARKMLWNGPLAWDEETIDDLDAVPQTDAVAPTMTEGSDVAARWLMGESVILDTKSRKEVLAYLFEWTQQTPEEIAAQLGMTPGSASMAWERIKRQARKENRPVPWRRVYALRDRDLTKNEMEQTA